MTDTTKIDQLNYTNKCTNTFNNFDNFYPLVMFLLESFFIHITFNIIKLSLKQDF